MAVVALLVFGGIIVGGIAYYMLSGTSAKPSVSIVNPAKIKYFMKANLSRNKTDAVDAKLICNYCELFAPHLWQPLTPEVQELQSLTKRVDVLNSMLLQEQNRLECVDLYIKESRSV